MIYFILTFFLGACVGSFVNVLIDRTIKGDNWVSGRSKCDYCGKTLSFLDMVPIMSFVLYGAKSRCCKKPLSFQYPIVESIVGLLFAWWLMVGFVFFKLVAAPLAVIQPAFWLFTGILMIVLLLADLIYGYVLMNVVWSGVVLTIVYRLTLWSYGVYQVQDFVLSIITAALLYGAFYLLWKITKGRGMADGDMYVALYIGLLLGFPRGVIAILLSFVLGAVVGVSLIATQIRSRKDTLPFVPFMITAAWITLVFGNQLIYFLGL